MPCADPPAPPMSGAGNRPGRPGHGRLAGLAGLLALLCAGCGSGSPGTGMAPAQGPGTGAGPAQASAPSAVAAVQQPTPTSIPTPAPGNLHKPDPAPRLAPAGRAARSWDDYRHQAALRIVAANPLGSFDGPVPEPLLAIPVLEIELNADGSVRRIVVLRRPKQALDTVQLAIDAVQRAAPFAPVTKLPKPWKFAEVFLFDEQRRFKPRSLDL